MRRLGVGGWLMAAVVSMCAGAEAVVEAVYGDSGCFGVKVGVHRGSALGPLLFVIVMEAVSRGFGVALPWELLCADGLVVVAEAGDGLVGGLNGWRGGVGAGAWEWMWIKPGLW